MGNLVPSLPITATSPATGTRTLNPAPINFAGDWRKVSEKPGEVILTNIGTDLGMPLRLRIAYSEVADVFNGTGVVPTINPEIDRRGINLLVQMTGAGDDSDVGEHFPWGVHLVIKVPVASVLSESCFEDVLEHLLGALYETKATTLTSRWAALVRGSIAPPDV